MRKIDNLKAELAYLEEELAGLERDIEICKGTESESLLKDLKKMVLRDKKDLLSEVNRIQ